MNGDAVQVAGATLRGRTILTARALRHLAVRIVASASGTDPRDIALRWDDAGGGLHATVTLPLRMGSAVERTLEVQGAEVRASLVAGMAEQAGRRVDGVDLRYAGVRREDTRRVR
jgi:hypothetical protein